MDNVCHALVLSLHSKHELEYLILFLVESNSFNKLVGLNLTFLPTNTKIGIKQLRAQLLFSYTTGSGDTKIKQVMTDFNFG